MPPGPRRRPRGRRGHAHRQPGRPVASCRRCPGDGGLHLLRGHPQDAEIADLLRHIRATAGLTPPPQRGGDHTRCRGRAKAGASVVIVTDAGTPLVSDPGARLVRAALADGIPVETVPGPSAALAALVVSGLSADRFSFEGFLPRSGRQRSERLAAVAAEADRAVVIFESPHRLQRALDDLVTACGPDRPLAVCRELTKLHEEVWRATTGEAAERARGVKPRGEYVLVLGPVPAPPRPGRGPDNEGTDGPDTDGGEAGRFSPASLPGWTGLPG